MTALKMTTKQDGRIKEILGVSAYFLITTQQKIFLQLRVTQLSPPKLLKNPNKVNWDMYSIENNFVIFISSNGDKRILWNRKTNGTARNSDNKSLREKLSFESYMKKLNKMMDQGTRNTDITDKKNHQENTKQLNCKQNFGMEELSPSLE